MWLLGREEENRSPGWSVLAGQGVAGVQLKLCHFDGRAAEGRCALIESQPKALGEQWIAQEC